MPSSTAIADFCTEAQAAAQANAAANLDALVNVQPDVAARLQSVTGNWEWLYARDGSLTGRSEDGRWIGDCSVPSAAAAAMLTSVDLRGTTACLLAPTHAMQVRRALDLLGPAQSLIAIVPGEQDAALALRCDDFACDIRQHRLLLAVGDDWRTGLDSIFRRFPGLPTPSLFLRPPTTADQVAQPLIDGAQQSFRDAIAAQSRRLEEIATASTAAPDPRRICVVAPSLFRLWEDAGNVLADVLSGARPVDVRRFDPDRPTTASNLAMAEAVRGCGTLVTANFSRSDVPAGIVPPSGRWLTWVTTPNIPSGARRADHDTLLLADARWTDDALRAGWSPDRIVVAGWPTHDPGDAPANAPVGLIVDTRPIRTDIDEDTFEFSSHMVLWELITSELATNPLLAADDAGAYLDSRMDRLSITPQGFNRAFFLDYLVHPAYHQGLARLLIRSGINLRVWGKGWDQIAEFLHLSGGTLTSRSDLQHAAAQARLLVRPTKVLHAHPVDALGRPVVSPGPTLLHDIRRVRTSPATSPGPVLVASILLKLAGL